MRKLCVSPTLVAVLVLVPLLAGCPKKPAADADAGDATIVEASTVTVVDAAPATPTAKNAADVARFPAEKALVDDDIKTVDLFTQAKTGPKSGNNVALIKAGTDPFKIAEFQDCVLVTFPDPKDASVTLMGWIPKAAFTLNAPPVDAGAKDAGSTDAGADAGKVADAGAADAGKTVLKCAAGQEAVMNVGGVGLAVCRKKCAADKDCKTPSAGACAPATTQAGKITKVCAAENP